MLQAKLRQRNQKLTTKLQSYPMRRMVILGTGPVMMMMMMMWRVIVLTAALEKMMRNLLLSLKVLQSEEEIRCVFDDN